jgi:SAM-dependent methyltransferase
MTPQHFDESYPASGPETYERYFVPVIATPLATELIGAAALNAGERVLDVGCGTGIVARLAAREVGPEGVVEGVDVNPGMLAVAKAASGAASIGWHEASAESMPFGDDTFDAALCQMSLQFVEDPPKALEEMRRVLKPKGRAVLNVPGPTAPLFEVMAEAMGRHIMPKASGFVRQVFSMHDVDEVGALLSAAGFDDVSVRAGVHRLKLPKPKDFFWQYVQGTPLAQVVAGAETSAREALEAEVVEGWREFEVDGGMEFGQRVVVATARA